MDARPGAQLLFKLEAVVPLQFVKKEQRIVRDDVLRLWVTNEIVDLGHLQLLGVRWRKDGIVGRAPSQTVLVAPLGQFPISQLHVHWYTGRASPIRHS